MNPEDFGPAVAHRRSAHASLRGYLYQACLGVQRWLALTEGEVLVCEEDEDLVRRILGDQRGGVFEQVKDYRGRLGLGDAAVVESLRHFLRGYVALRCQSQPGRYVFTTTAEPRRRKAGLDYDLLQKWRDGDRSKKVCQAVRKILAGKGSPEWVAEPVAWLDGEAEGWKGFLDAVEWTFEAPDLDAVRGEICQSLEAHPGLQMLAPEDVVERLVGEVLRRSSRQSVAERTLTRDDLARLADRMQAEWAAWARKDGRPLRRMFEDLAALDRLLDDHTSELRENRTPGRLLTAAYEVIPFQEAGREGELAGLADWCNGGERRDVLLLTGEGGAGKTRLGIEWCRRLRHQGWHAGFLRWDRKPADLDPLLTGTAPRLIVIDYAETRLNLLTELLYKLALHRRGGPKVRLLLLSRQAGDWWEALREGRERAEIGDLLGSARAREVKPLVRGREERRSAFRAAAEGFALAQGGKLPKHLPEPPFENPDFDRALYLHMAALAALEGNSIGSTGDALAATLAHERRFWTEQVKEMRLDESLANWMETALDQAMAALTLIGGAAEGRARALLGRVPDLPAGRTDLINRALVKLRQLYGRRQGQGPDLEPLRPDLLGEELVASRLESGTALLDQVLDGATPGEAQYALTVLTRLSQRRSGSAEVWLAAAFRGERLEQLAELALEVAVETGDPVGMVLAREVEERASRELARRLMDRCGEERYLPSVWLREVSLASTQRCFALLPEAGSPLRGKAALLERARLAHNLGKRLSDLGRREAARSATEEAVECFRALSSARPEAFLPELAMSLNNLGTMLSELGRREEALSAIEESLGQLRALAVKRPDSFLPELTRGLNNLGVVLSELGRREEALSAMKEAVEQRRVLSAAHSHTFLPELAESLKNIGVFLSHLGRREEALSATQESIEHYRALSQERPDAFLPDLAASLNNITKMLNDLGRQEAALSAAQEAAGHYRALARARPEAFLPDLAMSLQNLGIAFGKSGRREEALSATEEAVECYRTLSRASPGAFLPDLARSVHNLGLRLSDLGRREEALLATEEAVEHRRTLSNLHADAFLPDLARSLDSLGLRLNDLERREEALPVAEQAVDHYRTFSRALPDAYLPDLAGGLHNLSLIRSGLGRHEEALAAAREAVKTLAPYFLRQPAAFSEGIRICGSHYLRCSRAAGQEPDLELLVPLAKALDALSPPPAVAGPAP